MNALRVYRDDGPVAALSAALLARALPRGRRAPVWLVALVALVAAAPPVGAVAVLAAGAGRPAVLVAAACWSVIVGGSTATAAHDGPLDWLAVPLLRGAEYAVLAMAGLVVGGSPPVVFTLVCLVALHDYDSVDRVRQGLLEGTRRALLLRRLGLGWDGRLLLAGVATVSGHGPGVYVGLTAYLGAVFLVESARGWTADARTVSS